jgi:hypothetical protein
MVVVTENKKSGNGTDGYVLNKSVDGQGGWGRIGNWHKQKSGCAGVGTGGVLRKAADRPA